MTKGDNCTLFANYMLRFILHFGLCCHQVANHHSVTLSTQLLHAALGCTLHGHGITKEQTTQVLAPVDNCCLEGSCSFCQAVEHQISRPLNKCYYTSSGHHMVCVLLTIAEPQPSKQSGERASFQPQQLSSSLAAVRLLHYCVVKRIRESLS